MRTRFSSHPHGTASRLALAVMAVAAVLWLGGALAGCGSSDNPAAPRAGLNPPPSGSGTGLLAVSMTVTGNLNASTPAGVASAADHGSPKRTPIASLWITFDSIRAYPVCGDSLGGDHQEDPLGWRSAVRLLDDDGDSTEADDDSTGHGDDDCGYQEILTDPVTVNVADLDSTLSDLLGSVVLPAGDYSHLALHLADAWVVTEAGDSVSAELPGGMDNLLKVVTPFTVDDGGTTEIVIFFDLDRSVVEAPPGSLNFKIKPVLHGHMGPWEGHHGDEGDDDGQGAGADHGNGNGGGGHDGNGHS